MHALNSDEKRFVSTMGLYYSLENLMLQSICKFVRYTEINLLTGCIDHWPAMTKWTDLEYLKKTTGSRTVPIEIGKHYLAEGWATELMLLSDFITRITTGSRDKVTILNIDIKRYLCIFTNPWAIRYWKWLKTFGACSVLAGIHWKFYHLCKIIILIVQSCVWHSIRTKITRLHPVRHGEYTSQSIYTIYEPKFMPLCILRINNPFILHRVVTACSGTSMYQRGHERKNQLPSKMPMAHIWRSSKSPSWFMSVLSSGLLTL